MRRETLVMAAAGSVWLFSGCIVYDRRTIDDPSCDWVDTALPEAPETVFRLDPEEGFAGETFIVSLVSDPVIDYASIESVDFLGEDVDVCTSQARPEELLLTLSIAENANPRAVDGVIELVDGTTHLAHDILEILAAPEGETGGDGGPGSDTGGDEGGGNGLCGG